MASGFVDIFAIAEEEEKSAPDSIFESHVY
jgi:hypothetical protein